MTPKPIISGDSHVIERVASRNSRFTLARSITVGAFNPARFFFAI